jgi:hypothetical protein
MRRNLSAPAAFSAREFLLATHPAAALLPAQDAPPRRGWALVAATAAALLVVASLALRLHGRAAAGYHDRQLRGRDAVPLAAAVPAVVSAAVVATPLPVVTPLPVPVELPPAAAALPVAGGAPATVIVPFLIPVSAVLRPTAPGGGSGGGGRAPPLILTDAYVDAADGYLTAVLGQPPRRGDWFDYAGRLRVTARLPPPLPAVAADGEPARGWVTPAAAGRSVVSTRPAQNGGVAVWRGCFPGLLAVPAPAALSVRLSFPGYASITLAAVPVVPLAAPVVTSPPAVALCTMVAGTSPSHLRTWLDYHLTAPALGVGHAFVYVNEPWAQFAARSDDAAGGGGNNNMSAALAPLQAAGRLTLVPWAFPPWYPQGGGGDSDVDAGAGHLAQSTALNHCHRRFAASAGAWLFLDVDEFAYVADGSGGLAALLAVPAPMQQRRRSGRSDTTVTTTSGCALLPNTWGVTGPLLPRVDLAALAAANVTTASVAAQLRGDAHAHFRHKLLVSRAVLDGPSGGLVGVHGLLRGVRDGRGGALPRPPCAYEWRPAGAAGSGSDNDAGGDRVAAAASSAASVVVDRATAGFLHLLSPSLVSARFLPDGHPRSHDARALEAEIRGAGGSALSPLLRDALRSAQPLRPLAVNPAAAPAAPPPSVQGDDGAEHGRCSVCVRETVATPQEVAAAATLEEAVIAAHAFIAPPAGDNSTEPQPTASTAQQQLQQPLARLPPAAAEAVRAASAAYLRCEAAPACARPAPPPLAVVGYAAHANATAARERLGLLDDAGGTLPPPPPLDVRPGTRLLVQGENTRGRYSNMRYALLDFLQLALLTDRTLLAAPFGHSPQQCAEPLPELFDWPHLNALVPVLAPPPPSSGVSRQRLTGHCGGGGRSGSSGSRRRPTMLVNRERHADWRLLSTTFLPSWGQWKVAGGVPWRLEPYGARGKLVPLLRRHDGDTCLGLSSGFWVLNAQHPDKRRLHSALRPAARIQAAIDGFLGGDLRGTRRYVGVHLRLTDLLPKPLPPTTTAASVSPPACGRDVGAVVAAVRRLQARHNLSTLVALATDDPGSPCARAFAGAFPAGTVLPVTSGGAFAGGASSCSEAQFVQEVLAQGACFVGTSNSTLSAAVVDIRGSDRAFDARAPPCTLLLPAVPATATATAAPATAPAGDDDSRRSDGGGGDEHAAASAVARRRRHRRQRLLQLEGAGHALERRRRRGEGVRGRQR